MRAFLTVTLPLFFLCPILLGQGTWVVVPGASEVGFQVRTMVVHHVRGRFAEFSGQVTTERPGWLGGRVVVTVRAASVDSENSERDENVRGEDFLYVTRYPEIQFEGIASSRLDGRLQIVGSLAVRGVTRPFVLWAEEGEQTGDSVRFTATGALNRWDYGIRFARSDFMAAVQRAVPIAGDSVHVHVTALLVRSR